MIKLRILKSEDYPGLSKWANVITRVLLKGRQKGQNQIKRVEDSKLLFLKMKEGVKDKGMYAAF